VSDPGKMELDMQNDDRMRYGARMMMREKRFVGSKEDGRSGQPEKGEGEVR